MMFALGVKKWFQMKNKFFILFLIISGVIGLTLYLVFSILKTLELDSFDFEEDIDINGDF